MLLRYSSLPRNEDSREGCDIRIIFSLIWHPVRSYEVYLISFLQIQDDAEASCAITSIIGTTHVPTILHEISTNQLTIIVEIGIELVGAVLRYDEFSIIVAVVVVNVATSDVGDNLAELQDFFLLVCGVLG